LHAAESDIVGFVDSDGQCDPHDFSRLLAAIKGFDFVIGYRQPRRDRWIRLAMSRAFGVVYRLLFSVRLRDPSSPYCVMRRAALDKVLSGNIGILKQGFWWEFNARILAHGFRMTEVPVTHRGRMSGGTQIYRPFQVPKIAWQHLCGLLTLKRELAALHDDPWNMH
jgi:glycosyltransferase involved in cell wall biosynthesis